MPPSPNSFLNDFCNKLVALQMIVADVYMHRFHKILTANEGLSHILERDDIFIYEVPAAFEDETKSTLLHLYKREKR